MSHFRAPTIEDSPLAAYANADCDCAGDSRCAHAALACEYTGHSAIWSIEEADRLGLPAKMLAKLADGAWHEYLGLLGSKYRERATGALWFLELQAGEGLAPKLDHAAMRLTDSKPRRLVPYDDPDGGVIVHAVRIAPDAAPEERYAPGQQIALF